MPDDRDNPIDPPDNQGGGTTASAPGADSASTETDDAPIDPPDNQGGGS